METYIDPSKIKELYKKYQKMVVYLDIYMDELVDILNDIKLVDPEKPLDNEIKKKYYKIINELNDNIKNMNIIREIKLVSNGERIKPIELPGVKIEKDGIYEFGTCNTSKSIYEVSFNIDSVILNFDGCVEIQKSILGLKNLTKNILEYENNLLKIEKCFDK